MSPQINNYAVDYGTLPDGSDIYTLRFHEFPQIAMPISVDCTDDELERAVHHLESLIGRPLARDASGFEPLAIYALGDENTTGSVLMGGTALPESD